jgi:acetyltransferase-like isoleucine patch superfamily enzyme
MPKRTKKMTLGFFFLAILAILLPFGSIIAVYIGVKTGFISKNSYLTDICSSFSSKNGKNTRDNAHLGSNVVIIDNCKTTKITTITKYYQIVTQQLPVRFVHSILVLIACILLIKLAPYMHIQPVLTFE